LEKFEEIRSVVSERRIKRRDTLKNAATPETASSPLLGGVSGELIT